MLMYMILIIKHIFNLNTSQRIFLCVFLKKNFFFCIKTLLIDNTKNHIRDRVVTKLEQKALEFIKR